ncbi:uncharacterized protein [Linepithema humile]|uniref:uncharacterized protein n=1 Tax=Linepithema humile TaxID=83485 RepID=UPI00351E077D
MQRKSLNASKSDVFEEPNVERLAKTPGSIQEISSPSSFPILPISSSIEESIQLKVRDKDNSQDEPLLASSLCYSYVTQTSGSIGEIDEIIEYIHQNVKEANKALAALSEHDPKLESHIQLQENRRIISTSRGRKRRRKGILESSKDRS